MENKKDSQSLEQSSCLSQPPCPHLLKEASASFSVWPRFPLTACSQPSFLFPEAFTSRQRPQGLARPGLHLLHGYFALSTFPQPRCPGVLAPRVPLGLLSVPAWPAPSQQAVGLSPGTQCLVQGLRCPEKPPGHQAPPNSTHL